MRERAAIRCLINLARARAGDGRVRASLGLHRVAEAHALDMGHRRFFAHVTPDGADPQQRIAATGYVAQPLGFTGENIAWGEDELGSPAAIVDGWMHSPHHRENILRPQFGEVGVGIVRGGAPGRRHILGHASIYTTDFGG